jgi:hypothetical protein
VCECVFVVLRLLRNNNFDFLKYLASIESGDVTNNTVHEKSVEF